MTSIRNRAWYLQPRVLQCRSSMPGVSARGDFVLMRGMSTLIERTVQARKRDLGGFEVRRVLPYHGGHMVGPFIFLDHMGPADFPPGQGLDVRPHPHIGLATVTYLFEGELIHRDSLGYVQAIQPGDVNWMTAGRGVVHSERTGPRARAQGSRLHGLQSWVALPITHEEATPAFHHHPADGLPTLDHDGARLRVIAGSAYGLTSPVVTLSDLFYVDVVLAPTASILVPEGYPQRALYVVDGEVAIGSEVCDAGMLPILTDGARVEVRANTRSRLMLLGGANLDGERHIWWNFVSSARERIEQAKADWRDGRFGTVQGETDPMPLPAR